MSVRIEVPARWPLDCAWEASETCHVRRVSNAHLDAKAVLERLWNIYEGAFGSAFESILEKHDKYEDK